MSHRLVEDHAKTITDIVAPEGKWLEPKPTVIVCDHDAEGRATLEKAVKMGTTAAHKAVTEGIEAVQLRLRDAGDGRPRIFLLRNAVVEIDPDLADASKPTSTIEEVPGYCWTGRNKEEPVKADDHGCDAMRYVVAERDFGIRPIYRSVTV
jgi:phage terminase large subunit